VKWLERKTGKTARWLPEIGKISTCPKKLGRETFQAGTDKTGRYFVNTTGAEEAFSGP
jgi:hypothetical protein